MAYKDPSVGRSFLQELTSEDIARQEAELHDAIDDMPAAPNDIGPTTATILEQVF